MLGAVPVDDTALALDDHPGYVKNSGARPTPLTGDLQFGRVVQGQYGAGAKGLQQLMDKVSSFLSKNLDAINANAAAAEKIGKVDKTVTRIVFTRSQARAGVMIDELRGGSTPFGEIEPATNSKQIQNEAGRVIKSDLQFLDVVRSRSFLQALSAGAYNT